MTAWEQAAAPAPGQAAAAAARLADAHAAWDAAIETIDAARKKEMAAPGLQEPAKKALATLDREWDGLIAHRDYPMTGLDNYPDDAVMPMSAVCGGLAAGQGGALAA
jgi:transposase